MAPIRLTLAQVATEYGALAARDAFLTVKNVVASSGTEILLIGGAVLVALYVLTRWM
jgi:hypothetical protein